MKSSVTNAEKLKPSQTLIRLGDGSMTGTEATVDAVRKQLFLFHIS